MSLDPHDIRDRLLRIAKKQASRRASGAEAHDGALNIQLHYADFETHMGACNCTLYSPLSDAVLDAFERTHRIEFPDDYRFVLTQVGNGGPGLFHPFGCTLNGSWDAMGVVAHVGQPFPHSEAWNLDDQFWQSEPNLPDGAPPGEEDRLSEEWDRRLEESYWNPALTSGAIPICDLGCGLEQWLVVHGPQRGYVWDDRRADHAGLSPALDRDGNPLTFIAWCESWLVEVERTAEMPIKLPAVQLQLRVSRRRELLTLLLLVLAGVLLGVALAYLRG